MSASEEDEHSTYPHAKEARPKKRLTPNRRIEALFGRVTVEAAGGFTISEGLGDNSGRVLSVLGVAIGFSETECSTGFGVD